ncbi:MAG: hypothetical protein U9R74_18165 [Pseudomonadota bacterium]|nr:hypothetical protein [Pseudomonadota bacterium]
MSDSLYRLIFGVVLLVCLYMDWYAGIYVLIAMSLFEGLTNWRVPRIVNRILYKQDSPPNTVCATGTYRFEFDAERAWRLVVGVMLFVGFVLLNPAYALLPSSSQQSVEFLSWFLPWFMGFAILGAGLSGLCPLLMVIRALGFK